MTTGVSRALATGVQVWALWLDAPALELRELAASLDDGERARAASYTADDARREFIVTRAALRGLLAQRLGGTPGDVKLSTGPHGKPSLAASNLAVSRAVDFNVSHSGGAALIALSDRGPVGVDLEIVAPLSDLNAITQQVLSATELDAWRALPEAERLPAFYRLWTRKEACAKAVGAGLGLALRDIVVEGPRGTRALTPTLSGGKRENDRAPPPVALGRAAGWALFELDVGASHAAALACTPTAAAPAPLLRWLTVRELLGSA